MQNTGSTNGALSKSGYNLWIHLKKSNNWDACFSRDLDKIDEMMQDITEQQDVAQEITEALTRKVGDDFDEVGNTAKWRTKHGCCWTMTPFLAFDQILSS